MTKLMEDIVKIYKKVKEFDTQNQGLEKKIGYLNDKIAKTKIVVESRGRGFSSTLVSATNTENQSDDLVLSKHQSDYSTFQN